MSEWTLNRLTQNCQTRCAGRGQEWDCLGFYASTDAKAAAMAFTFHGVTGKGSAARTSTPVVVWFLVDSRDNLATNSCLQAVCSEKDHLLSHKRAWQYQQKKSQPLSKHESLCQWVTKRNTQHTTQQLMGQPSLP